MMVDGNERRRGRHSKLETLPRSFLDNVMIKRGRICYLRILFSENVEDIN